MKKRTVTGILVGGLMAAVVPIVAAAQTEGEITLTYSENMTFDYGQGSAMALPG